jgi:hypothetical protein
MRTRDEIEDHIWVFDDNEQLNTGILIVEVLLDIREAVTQLLAIERSRWIKETNE